MMNRWTTALVIALLFVHRTHQALAQQAEESEEIAEPQPQSIVEALLFFPTKFPTGDWEPKDLRFQDVFFNSQDGTKLHGWYCPSDKPRAVVLIAHGNAGHVASRAGW